MNVRHSLIAFVSTCTIAACGSGTTSASHLVLQLSSSDAIDAAAPRIEMRAGETRTVVLLAVGADNPVAFGGDRLPAFARLDGPILTLAPQRTDEGDHPFRLTATAGHDSSSMDVQLHVSRLNTAPQWHTLDLSSAGGFGDSLNGGRMFACPGPMYCTAEGIPFVQLSSCDIEGDGIVVDVEVVPRAQPFSKKATFSASSPPVYPPPEHGNCATVLVPMPGLTPEQSYDYSVRVSDQLGAVAEVAGASDGWYVNAQLAFDLGPCTARQCGGLPTGSLCIVDLDCKSRVCDKTLPFGPVWHCK